MSLTDVSFPVTVKKQFFYKWNSFSSLILSLMLIQLLGGLLSFNPTGSMGYGALSVNVNIEVYSAGAVIMLTCVWAWFSGFVITGPSWHEDDFTFVSNRLSSHTANLLFLCAAAVSGGVMAFLWTFLLKVIHMKSDEIIIATGTQFLEEPFELVTGLTAAFLYVFLSGLTGYTAGQLWRHHKLLLFTISAGVAFAAFRLSFNVLEWGYTFYFSEASFWLFTGKVILSFFVLTSIALLATKKTEVRI